MDIQQALNLFGLPFVVSSVRDGGVSTDYQLVPTSAQATLNRLKARLDDIQAVTGSSISIDTTDGLWLRTDKPQKTVYNFTEYNGYVAKKYGVLELPFMVGMTSSECVVEDLAKTPHLLVAGTTGSGKSNFLHTLILSMVCNKDCDVHLLDCKRVEFSLYKEYCDVFTDIKGAYYITAALLQLIDNRYKDMEKRGINTFKDYREATGAKYHVFVVDELADLISDKEAKKRIIPRLLRIAQIGRAAGVHMVLATQRPDHTVINGTLKGNIPTRIAFNCASGFDSRVILDKSGAEYLTGNGDGLYLKNGSRDLMRFQASYLPMEDLKRYLA